MEATADEARSPSAPRRRTSSGTARRLSRPCRATSKQRHHRWCLFPADPQRRPSHADRLGRRLDPDDRPQAGGVRRRNRRADRRSLAPGRLGGELAADGAVPWSNSSKRGGVPPAGPCRRSTSGGSPLHAGRSPIGGMEWDSEGRLLPQHPTRAQAEPLAFTPAECCYSY